MLKRMSLILLVCTFGAHSGEEVLSIDRVVPNSFNLAFPNESNIQPEQSDFSVNNFVLMSNDSGERWAVVTLTNTSLAVWCIVFIILLWFCLFLFSSKP